MNENVLAFFVAGLLSWGGVAMLLRSVVQSLVDQPNERSMHSVPTPRGGGLPVALAASVAFVLMPEAVPLVVRLSQAALVVRLSQAALVALIAVVGLLDDLTNLSWRVRLTIQLGATVAAVVMWGSFDAVVIGGAARSLGAIGIGLTIVWIAGLINAYNFMDGIDGLAGGQAVVAAGLWAAAALLGNVPSFALGMLVIAGAACGFLLWNWSPARIFMGDVGSTALGYAFAVVPLVAVRADVISSQHAAWLAVAAVWPFVYDAASTFIRRAVRGENVLAAHRTHTYQLLAQRVGHRPVAIGWPTLSVVSGGVVLAFVRCAASEPAAWVAMAAVAAVIEGSRAWCSRRALA